MDVEYIHLETNDDFLCQGYIESVGKNIIIATNQMNGEILIFNRKGKALKKINRLGQGAEEYSFILGITLDEDNGEIFINTGSAGKIMVYDLDGNFKRSFSGRYHKIYNFDQENLIAYDGSPWNKGQSFTIINKQDGSMTIEIQIPFKEKIIPDVIVQDQTTNMIYTGVHNGYHPILPFANNWLLIDASADTVFRYLPDHTMTPFLTRTPSVQTMDPEIFVFLSMLTDRYYFMETVTKKYNFETGDGFPATDLMYDKKEKKVFRYIVYNSDYTTKRTVYMKSNPGNNEIATWQPLEAYRLINAYNSGFLKGKLKEVAAKLEDDSNPVIMLIKYKK